MKRNKIKKILLGALMTLPIAWVSTACVNDNYSEPESSKSEQFSLWLNLTTQSASTRTEGHPLTDATEAESYIDIPGGDFKVYLYDGQDNYLKEFHSSEFLTSGDAENGYTATLPLVFSSDESQLSEADKQIKEIIKNKTANGLKVLVLANWKAFESQNKYPSLSSSGNEAAKSLNSILTNANDYNFSYNADNGSSWNPDHQASTKKLIPMFGMATVKSYTTVAEGGTYAIFNSVPMLRALAKIEVIDNIKKNDPTSKVSIKSVKLTKYAKDGRYIPNISITANQWWNGNAQITQPTLTSSPTISSDPLEFLQNQLLAVNPEQSGFVVYIPEMDLTGAINSEERAYLDVVLDIDGTESHGRIELADYNDNGSFTPWASLLRNHIYRYTVNSLKLSAELIVQVLEWDWEDVEVFDYEKNVGFTEGGFLKWSGNYSFFHDEQGGNDAGIDYITLEYSKSAIGTFTLSSPNGADYQLVLTTKTGKGNAFKFVDAEGNDLPADQGGPYSQTGKIVAQQPITFYITPSESVVNNEANQALLQLMVRYMDGDMDNAPFNQKVVNGISVTVPVVIVQDQNNFSGD